MDELIKMLADLQKRARALDGENTVPLDELLTPDFVSAHTRFADADEMLRASGFTIDTPEDFAAIPDGQWDDYVRSVTPFAGWQAMLAEAAGEWATRKLGLSAAPSGVQDRWCSHESTQRETQGHAVLLSR